MNAFQLGPARVHPQLNEIQIGERCERLPPKFIDVLLVLAERPQTVWAKNELLRRVWGDPLTGDEALTHAIWILRRTLGDDARRPVFIQTVPRRGYRLLLTPEPLDSPTSPAQAGPSDGCEASADPVDALEVCAPDPNRSATSGEQPTRSSRWRRMSILLGVLCAVLIAARLFAPPDSAITQFHAGDRLTGMMALDAGRILLSRRDGELLAVDAALGRIDWRSRLSAPAAALPAVTDTQLLLGSDDGYLYSLAIDDGSEHWRLPLEGPIRVTPGVLGVRLVVGSERGVLSGVDISGLEINKARVHWQQQVGGRIRGPVLVQPDRVLHATADGQVRAVGHADGRLIWERRFNSALSELRPLRDTRLVFALESGWVIALDTSDGSEAWRVDLTAAASAPVVLREQVFAIGLRGDGVKIDAGSGAVHWRNHLPVAGYQQPIEWQQQLAVELDRSAIGLVDAQSGVLRRRIQLPSPPDHLLAHETGLLVASLDGRVLMLPPALLLDASTDLRLDAAGNSRPLKRETGSAIRVEALGTSPVPWLRETLDSVGGARDLAFDAEGRLYVSDDAGVTAHDADGQLLWRYRLDQPAGTQALIADDRVLFGGNDGNLYALARQDGREIWRFGTGNRIRSAPRLREGRVFFGDLDGNVYALRFDDGSLLWRYRSEGAVHPALSLGRDAVYAGSGDHHVHALDPSDGRLLWTADMGDWVVAEPAISGDTLYVGVADGSLRALDAGTGEHRWRFESGGRIWFAIRVAGECVYFASGDGHVYAIDANSGKERWRQRVGTQAEGRIEVHRGVVYSGSPDAYLHALDAGNGRPLWRLATGGAVLNPGVAGNNLAVGSLDQRIHRLTLRDGKD